MNTYEARRQGFDTIVTVNGEPLDPRFDLCNHSTEFEWGYRGSGPEQLALALLAHHLGNDEEALNLHDEFQRTVVCALPKLSWRLCTEEIAAAVETIRNRQGGGA